MVMPTVGGADGCSQDWVPVVRELDAPRNADGDRSLQSLPKKRHASANTGRITSQMDLQKTRSGPDDELEAKGHGTEARSPDGNGVDLTLIEWMLSLTPLERLRTLQNAVNSLNRLRRGTGTGL